MAKKAKAKTRKAVSQMTRQSIRRFGIKNHLGGIWTPESFETEIAAQAYIDAYSKRYGTDLRRHKVVPVRVTVSILPNGARSR